MSVFLVFDELGSDGSRVVESIHIEAHGEFGVTCRALTLILLSKQHRSRSVRAERDAMIVLD
jgi:hypothetical protein